MKENPLERKTEISKLHFLVHPGWMMKLPPKDGESSEKKDKFSVLKELMVNFVKKAKTLGPDEMMVVFAPVIDDKFVKDFRENTEPYTQAIYQIKAVLGNRLIVLADSDLVTDSHRGAVYKENKEKVWERIKKIAAARGFAFSSSLTAEAYGELMTNCVTMIAENMHQAAGMTEDEPIKIMAHLTEYPFFLTTPLAAKIAARRALMTDEEKVSSSTSLTKNTKLDFTKNNFSRKKKLS